MAKLCPLNTFVDAAGEPLAYGKIYTYITGTSTAKTTYTDQGALTAHPNPVILGANGRKEIWLDTDQAYRFIIKDSNGAQIGNTIDDVLPTTAFAAIAGGQDLDITGYHLLTTGSNDLRLVTSTGHITFNGAAFPDTMGSATQVLSTDGTNYVWSNAGVANLDAIPDVTITSATSGDLLKYNGSAWINSAQSTLSITASQVSDLATSATAFSNKTGNISQWTNDSGYATATSATAFTNKTGNISQWTNDSSYLTGTASQAEMETGTSTSVYVTPGRMQHHPCMPKVMCQFQAKNAGTAACTLRANFGVTSITRVSAQRYTVVFSTAFADTNYFSQTHYLGATGSSAFIYDPYSTIAVGSIDLNISTEVNNGWYQVIVYGDQ